MSFDWRILPFAPQIGTWLGYAHEIANGEARLVDFGEGDKRFSLILMRSEDRFFAYLNRCPHFGVRLAEKQAHLITTPNEHIKCNVHYARFDWHDGHCIWGECEGESLLPIPVSLRPEDGGLYVGTILPDEKVSA